MFRITDGASDVSSHSSSDHSSADDALTPSSANRAQLDRPASRCQYCGAILNPLFYFCLGCGTPYKPVETVIPPSRPLKLTEGQLIQLKSPQVANLFWTYLGVLVFAAIFNAIVFDDQRLDLQLYVSDALMLITTSIVGCIYWRSLAAQLRRIGFTHWAAWVGLLCLPVFLLVNWIYNVQLPHYFSWDINSAVHDLNDIHVSPQLLLISFCILPAIVEEIAFRGLLQHWLQIAIKPWRAVMLASALFAALHFSLYSFPYLFAVGMLLGWTKWRTNSLYPSMLIHFLHNLAVIELFHG